MESFVEKRLLRYISYDENRIYYVEPNKVCFSVVCLLLRLRPVILNARFTDKLNTIYFKEIFKKRNKVPRSSFIYSFNIFIAQRL